MNSKSTTASKQHILNTINTVATYKQCTIKFSSFLLYYIHIKFAFHYNKFQGLNLWYATVEFPACMVSKTRSHLTLHVEQGANEGCWTCKSAENAKGILFKMHGSFLFSTCPSFSDSGQAPWCVQLMKGSPVMMSCKTRQSYSHSYMPIQRGRTTVTCTKTTLYSKSFKNSEFGDFGIKH